MSKSKRKLSKLIAAESGTDDESEHELSYYVEDRVKLMKEVLKIIKPKKMKSMAPECMKNMDMQEINSMLLEELLGISNRRLKYIFEGKTLEEDSSTDEDHAEDVISLDDISDDDFIVISDDETNKPRHKHKRSRIKKEPTGKRRDVKKEKPDKNKVKEIEQVKEKLSRGEKANSKEKDAIGEENLMSVLELLELQARARAIKSQLELESKKKQEQKVTESNSKADHQPEDDDEVIMEIPKQVEIIITSSDSESEATSKQETVQVSSSTIAPSEADSSSQLNEKSTEGNDLATEQTINEESLPVNVVNHQTMQAENKEVNANKTDSDSSSNDSLQVIQDRVKRKNLVKKVHSHDEKMQVTEPQELKKEQLASENSKLDKAIEKFIKSQPVAPENIAQREKMEQERNDRDEKNKLHKEKRLKKLKNEIESFKNDVAVENSMVNVLENIVIKPKPSNVDESDDLVINVDQDDVDCMICD
ncbi:SWR1-complex protein 3 [Dendroctonus ponderosae]|nr:SWR1-complex protein 3 [Dendroctonus ponderosae]KAH1026404.1 hypothetical protein HUJ05_000076 [Dendroctonus ponderosae]